MPLVLDARKSHVVMAVRLTDCGCVRAVILPDVRLYVGSGNEFHLMPQLAQLVPSIMGVRAGPQADRA